MRPTSEADGPLRRATKNAQTNTADEPDVHNVAVAETRGAEIDADGSR